MGRIKPEAADQIAGAALAIANAADRLNNSASTLAQRLDRAQRDRSLPFGPAVEVQGQVGRQIRTIIDEAIFIAETAAKYKLLPEKGEAAHERLKEVAA